MKIFKLLTLLTVCIQMLTSCTQFEDIGSDLVDGDQLLISTDTNVLYELETVQRDSLLAYVRQGKEADFIPTTHVLGQYHNPVFGNTRYDLTTQLQFSQPGLNFTGAEFDSAFLLLSYDTTFAPYGIENEMQTLDVYELEPLEFPEVIYTTDEFEIKSPSIGSLTYAPSYKNQNKKDSTSIPSHIRIPMTAEFGQRILSLDTTITSSVINMLDEFSGIVIRPREDAFDGAYRFFPYASGSAGTSGSAVSEFSGIRIYYTQDGESKNAYLRMTATLHHFTTVHHEYEGSVLYDALNTDDTDPSYLFIQPAGTGVRMSFSDLSKYQNKVINEVSIVWNIAGHPADDTVAFRPMPSIFAMESGIKNERPISDIFLFQTSGAYRQSFGGVIQKNTAESGSTLQYVFSLTNHFQRMVDGRSSPEVLIVPTPQDISRIERSVIYGPGIADATLRPQIKITYSTTNN